MRRLRVRWWISGTRMRLGDIRNSGGSAVMGRTRRGRHSCGGRQVTHGEGVVEFETIYSGWYPGEDGAPPFQGVHGGRGSGVVAVVFPG